MKNDKAITLISLVVTIVIIIILATVTISLSIGKNGIFTRAKETKKLQIIAEAKEQIGTQILAAQVDAFARNEELEQSQVEDIISKYGELQEDKDTIILKDNGYEISLLEIYNGTTTETGSYTDNKAKIELLEKQVAELQKMLEDSGKSEGEKTLVDSFFENTAGANGINDYKFVPKEDGLYTIIAYAIGNNSNTAIYINDVDMSNTALCHSQNFASSFTLLYINLKTTDTVKIHVANEGGASMTRQYWIYN